MYGCESWTIKEAEHQRIYAFKLWCWRRLLRVPWTARRSNQSFLKEINPEHSLEGLMLKLKLQNFGQLMPRTDSLEKTLMLGQIEGRRRRGRQRMRGWMASPTQWTWVWVNSGSWRWTGRPGVLQSMGLQNSRTRLSDWTTTKQSEKRKPEMQEHITKTRPRVIRRSRAILVEAACPFRGVTSGRRAETWLRRMPGYRAQGFFTKQRQGSCCKCVQLSYCPCSSMKTSTGIIHGIG